MTKKRAIIIGSGYGGIALANILGKAGYKVDVYEKNEAVGGRLSAFPQDGFTFDIGPSWYLMPEVFEQYYGLFGASATKRLDIQRLSPGYKIFFENEDPVIIEGSLKADARTFESIERGAGKKLRQYVSRSSFIYTISTQRFLYTNFTNVFKLIDWTILKKAPYLLYMALETLDRYVSKSFVDRRLKQILEYHMVFLGSSPFQAPAIYSLMSHLDFNTGVFYPRRGMMSLVDDLVALGAPYDITYHTDSPIKKIVVEHEKAVGVKLGNSNVERADVVVSNADLHHTETSLLSPAHRSYSKRYWEKRQAGPSSLVISLGIKGKLPQLLHHNLYFVDEWRDNFRSIYETMAIPEHASIYICNPTKTDPSLAPKGHENLFILVPLPSGVKLTERALSSLTSRIIATTSRIIDAPDLPSRIVSQRVFGPEDFKTRYNAWEYNAFGGQSHLLQQSVIFRTPNVSKKVKNLYYVGAGTLPGIGLPMCLMSAHLTYKRIAGIKDEGPLMAIEEMSE